MRGDKSVTFLSGDTIVIGQPTHIDNTKTLSHKDRTFLLEEIPPDALNEIEDEGTKNGIKAGIMSILDAISIDTLGREYTYKCISFVMILFGYFLDVSTKGGTFGEVKKVKERYGCSVEEMYGISRGPFFDLATSYWTLRNEIRDLFANFSQFSTLTQVLTKLEFDIGTIFFATSGPYQVPSKTRRFVQREILTRNCPEFDVERFLRKNPLI